MAAGVISSIDLSRAFLTRSPWRFTALQGADVEDPVAASGEKVRGAVRLCISNDEGRSCRPDLQRMLRSGANDDLFSEPHFLEKAEIVRPRPGRALLLVQVASVYSGDGDRRTATQVLAYDRTQDSFVSIYRKLTGRNNNQEVRYVKDGPLKGAMISAEPTDHAPYGFWIIVDRLTPDFTYEQALRYRSATRYGDGNPLAVIDSEMPNIEQRLGLWRAGSPLPLPNGGCPKPHLIHMELWCK